MNNIQKKVDESALKELAQAYGDETKARELLESWRWPHGPVCPHCRSTGEKKISKLEAPTTRQRGVRPGVYFCGACRRQFTVTVGTVLERSHVPLSKWLMALSLLCSSKKSLSANQVHRMIGVAYKTAWFLCHRIRLEYFQPDQFVAYLKTIPAEIPKEPTTVRRGYKIKRVVSELSSEQQKEKEASAIRAIADSMRK